MTQEEVPKRLAAQHTTDFSQLEAEFMKRVARIVWCSMATVDRAGRPRSRVAHPIWVVEDGKPAGYWSTVPHSHKRKHLAHNPHVSLSYWDPVHEQIYIDAEADWLDTPEDRERIWNLYKDMPEPLGYDLAVWGFWKAGPQGKNFGVLRFRPTRVELYGIADLMQGKPPIVWKPR
jgi:general stress protein 26